MTRVQELQLELIELVHQNNCKGKRVARLLRDNRHLWRAAFMPSISLYVLRDMEHGRWAADTLYLLPVEGHEEALEQFALKLNPDDMRWFSGKRSMKLLGYWSKEAEKKRKMLLALWWD